MTTTATVYARDLRMGHTITDPHTGKRVRITGDLPGVNPAESGRVSLRYRGEWHEHHTDDEFTVHYTKAQAAEAMREHYARLMRMSLREHATIYTASEYASKRASAAHVHLYVADTNADGTPYIRNITPAAALATGNKLSDRLGIVYGGYGYSKEFQAVYGLGRALFPNGYHCTGENCRSNDHANGTPRNGMMHHNDGGYYFYQVGL